jgi:peptidoglycan hydrolase-like protein with peptidoglycan-binding domain
MLSLIIAPGFSLAATATSTPNDGSSDSASVRLQRFRDYRYRSNEYQQKIDSLGSVANPVVLMPVLFGVTVKDISPNFGDPRGGGTRTHEGEDIMAIKGTPIVSPTPAVVLRVVTGPDEGNTVYTANPGGEIFVYMHLDRFGEGVVEGTLLSKGSLIGYVGNTGNASGGAAHLHFEIHNSSGTPTDPFVRLTGELSLQEKIEDLSAILNTSGDPAALAEFLVTNFRSTFKAALTADIPLPTIITTYMASIPDNAKTGSTAGETLPAGDLRVGSTGDAVIRLQQYLIGKASGTAASRLAAAGATGYFGTVTEAALIEYQKSAGISPANGYFGPNTRAVVGSLAASPASVASVPPAVTKAVSLIVRDLKRGMTGEDVRALQKILNKYGEEVAASGIGSPGNESTFFGPATEAAVIRFQVSHGITPAVGYVGPLTRAAILVLG